MEKTSDVSRLATLELSRGGDECKNSTVTRNGVDLYPSSLDWLSQISSSTPQNALHRFNANVSFLRRLLER